MVTKIVIQEAYLSTGIVFAIGDSIAATSAPHRDMMTGSDDH